MKYEIINMSDECYITSGDELLACVACLMLGGGNYGLKNNEGKSILPIFLFGGADEWIDDKFGNIDDFSGYIENHKEELAAVFDSFEYARERTSLNNIGARAKALAEGMRKEK